MAITPVAATAADAGAKGAETAGTAGAAKGAESAAGAGAANAGLTGFDALSAGLTPSGGAILGAGDVLAPAAGTAGELTGFDALSAGLTPSGSSFVGGLPDIAGAATDSTSAALPITNLTGGQTVAPNAATAGQGISSGGATAVAPPAGVTAPVDATSAVPTTAGANGGFNAIDAAAGQPGVNGAPSAIDKLLGTAESSIAKNPLGTALAAGGLGYNILQGQKNSAAVSALNAEAAQAAATGQTLQSYLQNGTLPPAVQAQVQQATAAARARILQNYANTPGGADPSKNSALAQELNNLDLQAIATASNIEQQLLQTGVSATGLSSNIYAQLAQIDATQTANIGKSIANFSAALSGTQPGVTLKVA